MNPATSINKKYLENLINSAKKSIHIFWHKELVISFKLSSGFTVLGRAAVVDPSNFIMEKGIKIATDNAIDQLWALEGYVLQLKLAGEIEDLRNEK